MPKIYLSCLWVSIGSIGWFSNVKAEEIQPKGSTIFQMVTGHDSEDDRNQWNAVFSTTHYVYGREPAVFLSSHVGMLPVGRALDIAMGEGRNAVYLAKKGFSVEGVDYSDVAIRKAKLLAKENHVQITTINADLNAYKIKPDSYDVILNIDFLLRPLIQQIKNGLKHGGIVVFENATLEELKRPEAKNTPKDWLLGPRELFNAFRDFEILVYEENKDPKKPVASLIARKP